MPLFGRQPVRDDANVTTRRRGWALFNPYPRQPENRFTTNNDPMNTTTTTTRTRRWRRNDAMRGSKPPRRIGRADATGVHVPLSTKVKRTLGIYTQPRPRRLDQRVDAGRPRRGWFSGAGPTTRDRDRDRYGGGRRRGDAERGRGFFF